MKKVKTAYELGYQAALLRLHKLRGYSEDKILDYINEISREIPIFGFYLQPAVGGLALRYRFWRKFTEKIEDLVAIKIAPFNRYFASDVVRVVVNAGGSREIALYTGNDNNIINDLLTSYKLRNERGDYIGLHRDKYRK